jgi:hypothetical protein
MEDSLMFNGMNSKKQGDVGLGLAIAWLTTKGYTVCIPLTDSQDYDLVAEIDGKLSKIQVKTTSHKPKDKNAYVLNLRVCGGNRSGQTIKHFNSTLVDYVFALTEEGTRYFIPSSEINNGSTINLGEKYSSYIV